MSIYDAITRAENEIARAKAELTFMRESTAYMAGVQAERSRIDLLILSRIDSITNASPLQAVIARKNELALLRQAILEAGK